MSASVMGTIPWGQGKDISTLNLGPAQQDLLQDLRLQQAHGGPAPSHIAEFLDGIGHPLVPVAVVVQR